MFRKRVDASPERDYQTVEELLTPARPPQPHLSNKQQDCEDDSVCNEGAAHDEVSQTLSQMIASAEALRSDATKQHLHPCHNWQCFSIYPVCPNEVLPQSTLEALL